MKKYLFFIETTQHLIKKWNICFSGKLNDQNVTAFFDIKTKKWVISQSFKELVSAVIKNETKVFVIAGDKLYSSEDNNMTNKELTTDITISSSKFSLDSEQKLYVSSKNKLYVGTIDQELKDLKSISNENFTNIYSLWYNKTFLYVGTKNKLF